MASTILPPIVVSIATFLLFINPSLIEAKKPAPIAPGPTAAPLNLTGILDKAGQYTTFIRLLNETQVGNQIVNQLNNSFDGLTIFAPTDNAFTNLKPGTLNSLTSQDQVSLVLYHVLPRFYSLVMFETTSNPVRTQASGNDGVYTVNVTSTTSQVNVSTGVDEAVISNDLYSDFPLAVYSVDKVLLPNDLFGPKPPAAAPLPSSSPKKPAKKPVSAGGPSADSVATPSAASYKGRSVGWGIVAGVGVWCIGVFL